MDSKARAGDVFRRYTERFDAKGPLIRQKIVHTLRVADLSERYARALGMPPEDAYCAWFLGLLHDIGRFEQARRYGTFVDSDSVDHAELGADLLFRNGLIGQFPAQGLPKDAMAMAESVVRLHNKLRLPDGMDGRTRQFAQVLRDADKTDIFRVIAGIPYEQRIGTGRDPFAQTGEASPGVMACVLGHRCVPLEMRRSRFEGRVAHCCMAFELVYEISRKTVREEGFLRCLLAKTDPAGHPLWTPGETAQLLLLRGEIEKAWGPDGGAGGQTE